MLLLAYHHHERPMAEGLQTVLVQSGHKVALAPIGEEIGSEAWQDQMRALMKKCSVVVALYTRTAQADEWFNWRIRLAREYRRQVFPVYFVPPGGQQPQMQGIHFNMQSDEDLPKLAQHISQFYPPRTYFVSYAREDNERVADICDRLRCEGLDLWRDVESIAPGQVWDVALAEALRTCTAVLFMASKRSVASANVNDELGYSLNGGKAVVPVMLEACDLPLRVHRAQWIDMRSAKDLDARITELARSLRSAG